MRSLVDHDLDCGFAPERDGCTVRIGPTAICDEDYIGHPRTHPHGDLAKHACQFVDAHLRARLVAKVPRLHTLWKPRQYVLISDLAHTSKTYVVTRYRVALEGCGVKFIEKESVTAEAGYRAWLPCFNDELGPDRKTRG